MTSDKKMGLKEAEPSPKKPFLDSQQDGVLGGWVSLWQPLSSRNILGFCVVLWEQHPLQSPLRTS